MYSIPTEWISSAEIQQRRSELFTLEQRRQKDKVGRIEKIEVRYLGLPSDLSMVMNRGISTPFNCAQRMYENFNLYMEYTVIKLLFSKQT